VGFAHHAGQNPTYILVPACPAYVQSENRMRKFYWFNQMMFETFSNIIWPNR